MVNLGGGGGIASSHQAVSRVWFWLVTLGFSRFVRRVSVAFFLVSPPTLVLLGLCLIC